jgi:AcrR family transcriptional regulator
VPTPRKLHPLNEPRRLSPARIGAAAYALVDSEGRAALSARRLAANLGCEAMSLYHHVDNMEAVLDLVVDEALAKVQASAATPRGGLLQQSRRYLEFAEGHPHVFAVVATRRWRTPRALALAEAVIQLMLAMGLSQSAALRRARILGAYLNGAGLALAAWNIAPGNAAQAATVRKDLLAGLDELIASIEPN